MAKSKAKNHRIPTEEERLDRYFNELHRVIPELPTIYAPRMKVYPLALEGVKLITVDRYEDARGCFSDHWHEEKFKDITGEYTFKQDSYVISHRGVIRGLHYQLPPHQQGKLVRCIVGSIQDVVVDIRKSSPTFGHWLQVRLDATVRHQDVLWIPPGFAHGYAVLGNRADVLYKMTEVHTPEYERTLLWSDEELGIPWEKTKHPILSEKDKQGVLLKNAEVFD